MYYSPYFGRFKLGTPYPAIVAALRDRLASPELAGAQCQLVVDYTGVGRPVVDMMRQAGLNPKPITITGGDTVTADGAGGFAVPKRDLCGLLQVKLQSGLLKFAEGLPEVPRLISELQAFQVKIDAKGHDSYSAWRESSHDDLVLAVAMAVWYGEKGSIPFGFVRLGPKLC